MVSMLLHAFLLVYYNEGFAGRTWLGVQMLAIRGNIISSTLLWMLVSGFLFVALPRIRQIGWGAFLAETAKIPGIMAQYVKKAGDNGFLLLMSGMGVALVISSILSSTTSLFMALGLAAVFASPLGRVLAILIQSSWIILVARINPEQAQIQASFGIIPAYVTMAGSTAGFLLATVLPFPGWTGIILLIVVALILYNQNRPGGNTSTGMLFWLITFSVIFLKAKGVLAHDGGWTEAGRDFNSWLRSEGAMRALLHGLGPSIGAAVGPALIKVLSGISPANFEIPTAQDSKADEQEAPAAEPAEPEEFDLETYETETEEMKPEDKAGDDGYDEEGYDSSGYDRHGYDRDGYDRDGYDRSGYNREGYDRDGYDRNGYDREGYDRRGFNAEGYDRDGYDRSGFDRHGYDRNGYDRDGYDIRGFDRNGINREGKTFDQVIQELREKMERLEKEQAAASRSSWRWGIIASATEWIQYGADKSIDVLEKVTGPAGQKVKSAYTVLKGTAEGLGTAIAEGGDYMKHMARGTLKGVTDLGVDKIKDWGFGKLGDITGGKLPGFKDYSPFNPKDAAWAEARTGFIKDALLGKGVDESVSSMVRDKFTTAVKGVVQDTIRDKFTKDPVMDRLFGKGD
ncbi:hypothetical protein SAMN02745221_00274 [Thermosyntropha lipolytica DSM 11003]|uniref:Uncharacterized protein n=1 Tax=Thermosyntropha lipolytica DSM 11003 TaxID=1123382 RepID=A0A1M5K4W0_9FIRM|nr:hypothetical protein SAMN02745221_00274 [Thermosyntropha lipolytica DSM 11003]